LHHHYTESIRNLQDVLRGLWLGGIFAHTSHRGAQIKYNHILLALQ